jgi:hypothetical protein
LNIITPNKQGISVGGGKYPADTQRSFGTIGLTKPTGDYYPSINIVSGNSNIKQKFTLGLNTHSPTLDKYTADINGPLRITNGELTVSASTEFEAICMGFSRKSYNVGVTAGTPKLTYPYDHIILYTKDTFFAKLFLEKNKKLI